MAAARGGSATRSTWRRRRGPWSSASPTVPCNSAAPSVGRAPRWLIGGSVPRLRWDDPAVDGFLERGEPIVLTDCPLVGNLVGRWSFDHLAQHFGTQEKLSVHFAPRDTSVFARHYGTGLGKGGVTPMSFADFAALCRDEHLDPPDGHARGSLRYYLQAPMVWNDVKERGPHGCPVESDQQPLAKANFGRGIDEDLRGIDWGWLRRAQDAASARPFDTCQLWAGHGGGSTPLHFDAVSNFLAQVRHRLSLSVRPRPQPQRFPH